MLLSKFSWVIAALALTFFVAQPVRAEEKNSHEGKVVKAGDGKLTMTDKDGNKEHTHAVADTAKITCDGKECKLEDLKAGYTVKVTTKGDGKDKTVTAIAAKKAAS